MRTKESDLYGREFDEQFLMHGADSGGTDIPHSSVEGFYDGSQHTLDTRKVSIGAISIRVE